MDSQGVHFHALAWFKAVINLGPVQAFLLAVGAASALSIDSLSAQFQAAAVIVVTIVLPVTAAGWGMLLRQRAKLAALRQELEGINRLAEDKREAERAAAFERLAIETDKAKIERQAALDKAKIEQQRTMEAFNRDSLQAKLDEVTRNFERMRENQHTTNNNLNQLRMQNEAQRLSEEALSHNLAEANEQILEYRRAVTESDKQRAVAMMEVEELRRTIQQMPVHLGGEIKQAIKDAAAEATHE